ncbi:MAG: nickel-dependent lactate racemase [candidate division KSB1 bacterium]|nr:nickel-dependent lactate racemase [candidate division KSB1 bacterium]MDZ7342319.1 nickel-dependent lactate racemase [candidate division KSB1 bacterium]
MKIQIDYGKTGLWIDVPEKNLAKILKMKPGKPLENPVAALESALQSPIASEPLAKLARLHHRACIVICDITRPVPNKILLPPILSVLEANGIKRKDITILIATGLHRPNWGAELEYLVGPEIAATYRIVNHDARNPASHTYLGTTSRGTPIWVDTTYIQADLKITTGFIEPHLMAGFSGGRKLICPGISSQDTIRVMHSPKILEHPLACEGALNGNPFHEEALEIARTAGVDFIVNVALDEKRQITGIFAGDLMQAHQQGVTHVRNHVRDTVPEPVDIAITTSAGFPLDATFYQSIKGVTAALPIVKPGGTIILAAECAEGLGSPEFSQLVRETIDLQEFTQKIWQDDFFVIDQWQLEELAKASRKAEVYLFSDGISPSDKANLPVVVIDSIAQGIDRARQRHGKNATIAVIPRGPYILAEVENGKQRGKV